MVNSRFSVAIHILSLIATISDKSLLTSDFIAGSVNTNPVVVRRMIGVLKKQAYFLLILAWLAMSC